jgi:hypothetical protein
MKQILTTFCCLFVLALGVSAFAQGTKSVSAHMPMKMKSSMVYACVKCDAASMKAGKCPMCGDAMKSISANVMYSCEHCHTTSMKAGKCPKCKMAMTKMAMTYACDHCHTTATMPGKCPKCKMAMSKKVMKVMG